MGILLITDELLELIGLSNRIIIMQSGRVVTVLDAAPETKPSEHDLLEQELADRLSWSPPFLEVYLGFPMELSTRTGQCHPLA